MKERETYLSVVVPLYNEAENLESLHSALVEMLEGLGKTWEIVYVDDGSDDGSFDILGRLHEAAPANVTVFRLRRRFGKAAALSAGFREARGGLIVTCDADGQDDPAEIPRLIEKLSEGYDLVSGRRKKRRDGVLKRIASSLYNFAARVLTGVKLHDINCGLKILRREVISDIELTGDLHRIVPLMAAWHGFRIAELDVRHNPRKKGRSKYGALKFPRGFLDLLMFAVLSRYSKRPGHFLGCWGLLVLLGGLGISVYFLVIKLIGGNIAPRYPLFVLGILLLVVGLQTIFTGFLAEMLNYNLSAKAEYSIAEKLREE